MSFEKKLYKNQKLSRLSRPYMVKWYHQKMLQSSCSKWYSRSVRMYYAYSCESLKSQRVSSDTRRAAASFLAFSVVQTPFFSMFSIVLTGIPVKRESAGTERFCAKRISLSFKYSYSPFRLATKTTINFAIPKHSSIIPSGSNNSFIHQLTMACFCVKMELLGELLLPWASLSI